MLIKVNHYSSASPDNWKGSLSFIKNGKEGIFLSGVRRVDALSFLGRQDILVQSSQMSKIVENLHQLRVVG